MPSINKEANRNTANLDSSNERSSIFCVTGRKAEPTFEKQKNVLDKMTELVEIFVAFPLVFTIFLGGMTGIIPASTALRMIASVSYSICQKIFCLEPLDQLRCNCAIRCGTRSDKESHRHTMRIHGQMYLGVEPPFVRLIA